MAESSEMQIETCVVDGVRWEVHRYAPGPASGLAPHVHECYQVGYSPNFPGQYDYRGERHPVPVGSLHVIHPGEVHAPSDPRAREQTAVFPTAFVPCERIRAVAEGMDVPEDDPFFPPVIQDGFLAVRFLAWCAASLGEASRLERDGLALAFLTDLIQRHGGGDPRSTGRERRAVRRIRAYLHAHVAESVSLDDLSDLVGLTPAHLNRVFRREVGMPPYRYLQRLRVERAAWRLAEGAGIADAAYDTGFADQAHLTRQFKQVVGVTPGRYRT